MKYIFLQLRDLIICWKLVLEFSFYISVKADWHILFSGVQFNVFISYAGVW